VYQARLTHTSTTARGDCRNEQALAIIENDSHSHPEGHSVPVPPNSKLGFFFSDHHRWLLQHVQQRLRNPADAQDTAADTFMQLLSARVDPDSIEQPRAYLSTIARRLIFDRHRRRKLELAYLERLAAVPEALAPSPEEQLLLIEALVAIDRAIDGLPLVVKATFLYSQLDGMSYVAIAQKLGLSERTVSRYMKQALRQCYLSEMTP
jgi:RNA polymerase sigma-70 factor (ECF subfamily)